MSNDDLSNYERRINFSTTEDWKFNYNLVKNRLVYDIIHGNDIVHGNNINEEDFEELKNWLDDNPDWIDIIKKDDVALFPPALNEYKKQYICGNQKDFQIAVEECENNGLDDLKLYNIQYYGVFLFDCMVGHKVLKELRLHLNMSYHDFVETYGESLYEDVNCLDELISELYITGKLVGRKRSYKIDGEL